MKKTIIGGIAAAFIALTMGGLAAPAEAGVHVGIYVGDGYYDSYHRWHRHHGYWRGHCAWRWKQVKVWNHSHTHKIWVTSKVRYCW